MKFLSDMGISPRTVGFLRKKGFDAVHLSEQGLYRMEDSAILNKAREEGRILLTHDLDFGEMMAASHAQLPSVIVFRLRNMRPENVNGYLEKILEEHEKRLKTGVFISVTEGRIRLRSFPMA